MRVTYHDKLRALHAKGLLDREIGEKLGRSFGRVATHRRRLGLPANRFTEKNRKRIRKSLKDRLVIQCRKAGVSHLHEIRERVRKSYAVANGWPDDLPIRCVLILNVLLERGPQTIEQLCEAMGVRYRGSRFGNKIMSARGQCLAILEQRGMVVGLGRSRRSTRTRRPLKVYALALEAEPVPVHERITDGKTRTR